MELRDSRWVDENGVKLKEHRHDHYNWHFVDTRHRSLKLNPSYPKINKIMRSSSYLRLKMLAPYLVDRLIEENNLDKIGAVADKRGGPLEIYLDKLLEDAAQLGYTHWGWDIFDDVKYDEELRDLASINLLLFFHGCYYIHEILHRMWHWESSHNQNKRRDRDKEENIVTILSCAINTQLYNHLFNGSPDENWETHRNQLQEAV